MRQLFLKIFLSVLLTVLFTFAISLAIAFWVMPEPSMFPPGPPAPGPGGRPPPARGPGLGPPLGSHPEPTGMMDAWCDRMCCLFELHARSLRDVIHREGPDVALQEMNDLSATWSVQTYLLNEKGVDVRGRDMSPSAQAIAKQATERDGPQHGDSDRRVVFAERIPSTDGASYVFVAETPEMPEMGRPPLAKMLFLRLAPLAIGLGLVCYFLARYIASPILKLRAAVRRFGGGDLEQRVGTSVGRRRDEIGELARDFDCMADRIATLLSAQRRLLQDISHELRSPLARQRVALELARQQPNKDAARALDRVEREAERLDELISELLTLTRVESGSNVAERLPTDLADLVREVIENAEFEVCNVTRSVRLVECTPCVENVVPELLRRAVENVVRNALAYTADDSTVEVSLRRDVSGAVRNARDAVQNAASVVMRVRDHGPGVPETELADIFRPFYRVSHARDRESGGVGLGLAIAERAVSVHGGSITATNHPDGGLVVEIRLSGEAIRHHSQTS